MGYKFKVKRTWKEFDHPRDRVGRFADKPPVIRVRFKGGPGSGNFGHIGRPGKVGGSASGDGLDSGVNYTTARASTWEEIEKTSNLFVFGEGKDWTAEEREIADQALAEFAELKPFRPVTELIKVSGDDVQFLARSLGNGRVAVSETFFNEYNLETVVGPQFGGRKGVLAHEIGHELADVLTREGQDRYANLWAQTRDSWKRKHAEGTLGLAADYSNYDEVVLNHWPSYQAMNGWHEDLAESYRILLHSGGEMGKLGDRLDILQAILKGMGGK